jgi:hypothetical protein
VRRAAATAVLLALVVASPARADVPLTFNRDVAAPGDEVEVSTPALPTGSDAGGITVYLLDVEVVDELLGQDGEVVRREPEVGPGVTLLGGLGRAEGGAGKLTFVVPDLPPGRYTTGVWCVPCGETLTTGVEPGATTDPGPGLVLRVTAAVPTPPQSNMFGRVVLIVTVAVIALGAALAGLLLLRRRRQAAVAG